jgi:hypothetical protein
MKIEATGTDKASGEPIRFTVLVGGTPGTMAGIRGPAKLTELQAAVEGYLKAARPEVDWDGLRQLVREAHAQVLPHHLRHLVIFDDLEDGQELVKRVEGAVAAVHELSAAIGALGMPEDAPGLPQEPHLPRLHRQRGIPNPHALRGYPRPR